jgi:predicted flap endonuclease-1-like 5' DNA nuclease
MTRPRKSTSARRNAPVGDDLTRVRYVGTKVQEILKGAGITSFADLAASDPERLAILLRRVPSMSSERIEIVRAAAEALAAGDAAASTSIDRADTPLPRERHTFSVEVVVDAGGRPDNTTVSHAQTSSVDTFAGWDVEALDRFVREQVVIDTPQAERRAHTSADDEPAAMPLGTENAPDARSDPPRAEELIFPISSPLLLQIAESDQSYGFGLDFTADELGADDPQADAAVTFRARQLETGVRLAVDSPRRQLSDWAGQVHIETSPEPLPAGTWMVDAVLSIHRLGVRGQATPVLGTARISAVPRTSLVSSLATV